jgi:hypothetical protein
VIPFVEVVGSTGATEPEQTGAIALNVGVILLLAVRISVAIESQLLLLTNVTE